MLGAGSVKVGDTVRGGKVTKIQRFTSGRVVLFYDGDHDRGDSYAPGKKVKVTSERIAPRSTAPSVHSSELAKGVGAAGAGRITSSRVKPGDHIQVETDSAGNVHPTRNKNSHVVEVASNELVPGDRQRRHKITVRRQDGTTATMVVSPSQTQRLPGTSGDLRAANLTTWSTSALKRRLRVVNDPAINAELNRREGRA